MERYRESENGWFDEPFLSDDEIGVDNFDEWFEHWTKTVAGAWTRGDALFREVYWFHRSEFQNARIAREALRGIGKFMYASNGSMLKASISAGLSVEDFAGLAWRRYALGSERLLDRADGNGSASLADVFVEEFLKTKGRSGDDAFAELVRYKYEIMLANTISGVVGERLVLELLTAEFPDVVVRRGSDSDENLDVDLWLNGAPISVKCGGVFKADEFKKYREAGRTKPVAYVGLSSNVDWSAPSVADVKVMLPLSRGLFTVARGVEALEKFVGRREVDGEREVEALANYVPSRRLVVEHDVDPFENFDEELDALLAS